MITRYPFPRRKLVGALFTLYLFLLMYLSRDSQAGLYLLGFYRAQFLSMGVTALAALALLFYNRKRIPEILTDGRIVLAILFSLTILIPMALKRDWQMMYFSMVYCVLAAVLISFFAAPEETARQYVVLMCLLSGFSLLCSYLLRIPADRGILVPPTFRNSFDAQFYNYIFSFVSVSFAKSRNFGIFREPGVHQFFLFLALYLNNYQVSWQSDRTMWAVNALLTQAFEVILRQPHVSAELLLQVVKEMSIAAGPNGMVGGQVIDMLSEGKRISMEELRKMHMGKTGALFRAAIRSGAIMAQADEKQLEALTTYADCFGLAFQITDDILDVVGDEAVIGKPVGSDERNDKSTYVTLTSLEEARRLAADTVAQAVEALEVFGDKASFLKELVEMLLERNK